MKKTIVIANKHPMTRIGLQAYFENSEFEVVKITETGSSGYSEIVKQKPDFAILDFDLPDLNGLEIAKLCKANNLLTKIIIFTRVNKRSILSEVGQLIDGYILKDDFHDALINAISSIINGNTIVSPNVIRLNKTPSVSEIKELLSPTELEVLKLVSLGWSSNEIGKQLHTSKRTIEKHRSSIIKKLGIESTQFGLIRWAEFNFELVNR